MKTVVATIVVLTIVSCSHSAHGQVSYFDYIDSTSEWNVHVTDGYMDFGCGAFVITYSSLKHYPVGDTLLGGYWYYKMCTDRWDSTYCSTDSSITIWLGTRPLARYWCDCAFSGFVAEGIGSAWNLHSYILQHWI